MTMDPKMDAAVAEAEAPPAPEVDDAELALAVAALVSALPECASIAVEGLDGDAPQVVCKPAKGDAITYALDPAALDEAIAALTEDDGAEGDA